MAKKELSGMCVIMRHPVLMEDEGRHFFIKGPLPVEEAKKWIESQKGEYFSPGDYYISEHKDG
jgi:hypothetical protein